MAFFGLFGSKKKKEEDDELIKSILAGPGNASGSTTRNEDSYSSKYAYNSATDSIDDIIKTILTNDAKTKINYDDNVIDPNIDENSLINRILQEQAQIEAQRAAEQRKREEEVKLKAQQEARANYYKDNKETIIKNRTSELIYNWNPEKGISNWDYKDLSSNDLKSRLGIEDLEVNTYLSSEDNVSYQKQREYVKNTPKLGYTDRENPFMDANILNPEGNTELIINRQKSAYENDFEEFNEALEKGQVKRANNSLERIIARRYGYSMNDGLWASIDNMLAGRDDRDFNKLQNTFDDNLKKLTEINESIKNGDDINVLAALNAEKDRLELDNKLIQYHRLLHIEAQNQMVTEYDSTSENIIQPWKNLSNYDLDTSNLLTTIASSFNYIVQTAGAVANTFGGGLDTVSLMLRDDQDEDKGLIFEAGDIKLQMDLVTVLDAATYLEPVTRTMRVVADMYTPAASVLTPYALNKLGMEEEAVLIEDGVAPSDWNALGAIGYATAGYLTTKAFKGMGDRLFGNQMLDIHKSVGRQMVTNIFKEASTEMVEEFVQAYSESMMYTEGFGYNDLTDKKLFADSLSAGLSAFVIAGGLSAGSTAVNGIYHNNVIGDGMLLRTDTSDSYKKLVDHNVVDGKTNVSFDNDTDTFNYIRNRLDNGEVITISSPDSLNYENSPSGMNQGSIVDISDIKSNNQITLSDLYTNNNATLVIVPSHQMANYISDLNPNANIVVVDTKSKTYLSDLNSVIQTQSKVNLAPIKTDNHIEPNTKVDKSLVSNLKNTVDNTINNLKTTIDKTVENVKLKVEDSEAPSKTIINANDYNKTPNQIANKVKVESAKVMNESNMSAAKKQTAFKQLSKDIASDLKTDTFESRAYIKSQAGNPVLFNKKGNNLYEATNKITREGDMLTMVKSNGKMINGNLDTSLNLDKNIVTTINNLIDNLKLKGDYITEKSTHRDIGNLINSNRNVAGELLQSLGYDALFSYNFDRNKSDNKSKGNETLTLITAHDNLDNFNLEKALENTNESINQIMNEVKTDDSEALVIKNVNKSNTATFDDFTNSQVEVKPKDMMKVDENGNIDIGDGKTIDSEYYTPEYNAIIDNTTFGKKPKDKKALKFTFNNIQALITDWYAPIMQHVKHKGTVVDHDVLIALDNTYNVDSIYRNHVKYGQRSFDGQTETGKSVEAIFDQLKGSNKKETKANNNKFQEMMYLYLHEERLRNGAEAIYEGVPGDIAVKRANDILNDNPKFKLVMDDIKQLNANSLDYIFDAGLINAVQYSDLKNKYKYYIPIYSNNPSDFVELGTPEWFKKAKQHNTLKETTLASLNIENLQDAIKSKLYMEIKAGYKNKLMQAIANSKAGIDTSLEIDQTTEIKKSSAFDTTDDYLYHIDYTNAPVESFIKNGIKPSKRGRAGAGVYLANTEQNTIYNVSDISEGTMYRVNKAEAIEKYGLYSSENESGNLEFDESEGEILLPGNTNISPELLEVKLKDGSWKKLMPDVKDNSTNNIDTDSETNAYSGNTGQLIYFDNGEVKQFMTTKEIAEAVDGGYRSTNIDKAFNLPVLKQFRWINKRVKSRMLTGWDPMFQAANLIRDYLDTAFINTNYNPASFTKNYLRAFGNVARGSQMYYDFASTGIVDLGPKNSIHRLIHSFEAMPKFAEYLTALDAGKSRQDAIIEARSANINMRRGGSLVKQLNSHGVIFLNMAVQGADKAVGSGIKLVRGANTPKGFVKLVTVLGAAAAPGVINSLLNEDDEDYQKLPYYLKNNYFFIKGSDGQFTRIPKGRVTGFIDTLFRYASGISSENTPKDYVDSIADVVKNSILPIEISGSFPLYSEYQGLIGNETFTGGEIWSENDSEEVKREKQFKYFVQNYTGRFGKTLIAATDNDASTDVYSSSNYFHFDSTRYNKNLSTVYDLKSYYENKDNVKTFEDQIKKKYIDTQMSNLNQNIRATINKGKDAGLTVQELRPWYQASDAITNDIIRNINNYVVDINGDGSYTIYFDDLVFDYKLNKHSEWKFTKRK